MLRCNLPWLEWETMKTESLSVCIFCPWLWNRHTYQREQIWQLITFHTLTSQYEKADCESETNWLRSSQLDLILTVTCTWIFYTSQRSSETQPAHWLTQQHFHFCHRCNCRRIFFILLYIIAQSAGEYKATVNYFNSEISAGENGKTFTIKRHWYAKTC